jgi:hypothetical protein
MAQRGIGKVHRIPLGKLVCMSPKRVGELTARLGGEPGRARLDFGHGRPLFRFGA